MLGAHRGKCSLVWVPIELGARRGVHPCGQAAVDSGVRGSGCPQVRCPWEDGCALCRAWSTVAGAVPPPGPSLSLSRVRRRAGAVPCRAAPHRAGGGGRGGGAMGSGRGGRLSAVALLCAAAVLCQWGSGSVLRRRLHAGFAQRRLSGGERRDVQREILAVLGLPGRPRPRSPAASRAPAAAAPLFMLDLYHAVAGEEEEEEAVSRPVLTGLSTQSPPPGSVVSRADTVVSLVNMGECGTGGGGTERPSRVEPTPDRSFCPDGCGRPSSRAHSLLGNAPFRPKSGFGAEGGGGEGRRAEP